MPSSPPTGLASKVAFLNYISLIVYGIRSSAPLETRKKIILVNAIARNAYGSATTPATREVSDDAMSSEVESNDSGYDAATDRPEVVTYEPDSDTEDEREEAAEDDGQGGTVEELDGVAEEADAEDHGGSNSDDQVGDDALNSEGNYGSDYEG